MKLKLYLKHSNVGVTILIFVCFFVAFTLLVVKNLSSPLAGGGDTDYWEYPGFFLAKNISFTPFPHLNLINNQAFYPYGTNNVFQPWSIERDLSYAILYSAFGIGPWIQFYYLFSVLLTAIGSFILLSRDYSFARASSAGFLIPFFSFYAIHKYPGHLCFSIFHWTALSLILDFLIVKRVTFKKHISLKLILLKVCLLLLSLGQDLGYIAGFALMSFTISTLFIIILLSCRYFKTKKKKLLRLVENAVTTYKNDFFTYPRISLALIAFSVTVGFINIPLVLQISRAAKSFDFTGVPTGAWWANPLRLLIPFFPGFNPGKIIFEQILGDSPEGLGAGSPGWFLLTIASVGLWQGRKKITIFIPLLIIFFFCLVFHPTNFPILKIFPWFGFNRVQGRCTVLYPIIFCLFALDINLNGLRSHIKQMLSGILVIVACTELYTAYSLKLSYQPYSFDNNFFQYMNYIKEQPGEAVLDWPFCAVGGNGVGSSSLCPYFLKNGLVFSLRRFHHKKVLGQYFGRLHPSQIEPYLKAGWDKLLLPDNPDIFKATRQTRCFKPDEWSFFTDFYKFNDFAGINLYVELMSQDCVEEFYKRFGKATMETKIPSENAPTMKTKVAFIPKSSQLRDQVDLKLGNSLKFEPFLDLSESNLLRIKLPHGLNLTGLSQLEKSPQHSTSWRWALGRETRLTFKLPQSQPLSLVFNFVNPINNQDVIVEVNQVSLEKFLKISKDAGTERRFDFQGIAGWNTVIFKYKDWNHNLVTFAPNEDRNLAIKFTQLAIEKNK